MATLNTAVHLQQTDIESLQSISAKVVECRKWWCG